MVSIKMLNFFWNIMEWPLFEVLLQNSIFYYQIILKVVKHPANSGSFQYLKSKYILLIFCSHFRLRLERYLMNTNTHIPLKSFWKLWVFFISLNFQRKGEVYQNWIGQKKVTERVNTESYWLVSLLVWRFSGCTKRTNLREQTKGFQKLFMVVSCCIF